MFKHDLVIPKKLKQTNIGGKRYYVLPDGITKFKSVTTILSENKDNSGIIKWRKKVGEKEANRVTAIATSRGTSIHNMAEKFLLNEEYISPKTMPTNIQSFEPIRKTLEQHVNNIRGIELPLYSSFLRAAGTTDLVADYDDVISIIDFKTSLKPKFEKWIEDYFLQSSIYALMFRGIYNIPINQFVIIITVDNQSEAQIFRKDIKEFIPRIKQIFGQ